MNKKVTIFWLRRDLRLHDNTALYYALQEDHPVLPLFIFDTEILHKLSDQSDARVTFIHQQLSLINKALEKLGSSIKIFYSTPTDAYQALLSAYDISAVYTNRDYEPDAIKRDKDIEALLKPHNIPFYSFKDQVIFESKEVLTDQHEPYKVFTPYKNKWIQKYESAKYTPLSYELKEKNWVQQIFHLPELSEIGFTKSNLPMPGASIEPGIVKSYHETRDFPALSKGTTHIGIHLRFGTISIRKAVQIAYSNNKTWLNELIWREFYMMILANFPQVVHQAFKPKYDHIPWRNDEAEFQKWCDGNTGYPIVDAGMRELNTTGYMHNRVRMIVASFLTKHLLIDWRWGEQYFASKLLDYELASNNGGWQWAAGTGTDAQPYFRVFNPYSQADKFDPDNQYIRKWVPEFDTKDYVKPIVDHKFARQRAIDTYKNTLNKE